MTYRLRRKDKMFMHCISIIFRFSLCRLVSLGLFYIETLKIGSLYYRLDFLLGLDFRSIRIGWIGLRIGEVFQNRTYHVQTACFFKTEHITFKQVLVCSNENIIVFRNQPLIIRMRALACYAVSIMFSSIACILILD